MREIKFREYDTKLNKWIYGDLYKNHKYDDEYDGKTEYLIHKIIETEERKTKYNSVNFNIDEYSIGQFAGIQDCNGRDIYEGDIVEYKEEKGYVDFLFGTFSVVLEEENISLYEVFIGDERIEVIDNLYEKGRREE